MARFRAHPKQGKTQSLSPTMTRVKSDPKEGQTQSKPKAKPGPNQVKNRARKNGGGVWPGQEYAQNKIGPRTYP